MNQWMDNLKEKLYYVLNQLNDIVFVTKWTGNESFVLKGGLDLRWPNFEAKIHLSCILVRVLICCKFIPSIRNGSW